MIKYEYETGMCKQLHYNGLWSVQYEGVPGHFKKVKMVCPCTDDDEAIQYLPIRVWYQ